MNTQQIKDLQAFIDGEKVKFDQTYTRDPNMSLNAKQEAFKRLLERLSPSLLKLKAIDDEIEAIRRAIAERKAAEEKARDLEQLLQMRRYQKREEVA